jgi:KH/beta-lactamase-domain protein
MSNLNDEILKELPRGSVSSIKYEAAKIVIYVKDKELFLKGFELGKQLAQKFKKRFEIRLDPKFLPDSKEIEERIRNALPRDVKLKGVFVEKHLSTVVLEVYNPEKIDREIINYLRTITLCNIKVKRAPLKSSKIIDVVRAYLHRQSEYRSKFLNKVGERILTETYDRRRITWIRLSVLGSGREVGRSCLLLQTPESNILLDFGVGVSVTGQDAFPVLNFPEFDINRIDAVVITHSHIDHIGFVPFLFKAGWRGPVYLTEPTRDLGALVLLDYIKVAMKQAKQAPYSTKEVKEFIKHSITLNYGEVTDITPDIKITLHNAGHILGSAMVHINVANKHNILYTGDFKFNAGRLLNRPNTKFPRLETLIIESTYGGKEDYHPPREEVERTFLKDIKEILKNKGKVLIPVLAVGRAQEILLILSDAISSGDLPEVPIYIEGILWETSMIHTAYPEFLSSSIHQDILEGKNPFEKEFIIRASPKERKEIMESKDPCIIVATSGMMNGGPIVDYFKLGAESDKNLLAFVSYQARGTLGRRILDGEKEILLNGDRVKVNLQIKKYDGFSGHSDRKELVSFISKLDPRPKQAVIVHGEPPKPFELASKLRRSFEIDAYVPKVGDVIRLD